MSKTDREPVNSFKESAARALAPCGCFLDRFSDFGSRHPRQDGGGGGTGEGTLVNGSWGESLSIKRESAKRGDGAYRKIDYLSLWKVVWFLMGGNDLG